MARATRLLSVLLVLGGAMACAEGAPSDGDACAGCGAADARADDARADDAMATADATADDAAPAADAGPADAEPDYLTALASPIDFARMRRGSAVKYLLQVTGATPRPPLLETCYFQNTARFEFHIEFLHAFLELAALTFQDYQVLVLRPATRIWWGGGVLRVPQRHPISGEPESLGYQIYAENGAVVGLREADIVEVDALLRGCMPYADRLLAFLPGDPFQEQLARSIAPRLAMQGIAVLQP